MTGFLLIAGVFILLTVLLGLVRVLRGPGDAERLMAVQLLGTGGVAALLLLGSAIDLTATTDLALLLALLAAFAAIAFVAGLGANPGAFTAARPVSAPSSHSNGDSPAGD
ncbi:MAG: sodium:proton antiporter [Thiohalocapsa sp.]|jgi:multicomponent Na+:H+ antiporter subunit F|uniref:monovalent cation/H+ antiporter complex subunit F n=1 Tax=Thiohalocapsa sp. TaxID=2497641 RepID=UPI0025FF887C|nr:monovalent cation/H+ antiporter complex subunit F [Thiohalocapsa sp.]MCG6942633.1 sodium:proton antiporter [Thiohalocapsa sp.]